MLNKKFIHLIMLTAIMLTGLFSLKPATPAHAATQTVNTLTDENDGSCLDGDCSLRDAIAVAADNDTITFSVTGTIVLTAALTVDKNLTITGPGSAQLTLDGNNQYQIFILSDDSPTNTINISGMTMTKGYANPAVVCGGGAIRSWAFLTMNDVVITNNHAPADAVNCFYPRGGGILVFDGKGSLTLTNSTVSNNSTYYGGGGIYFSSYTGNISLDNVTISGNQTTEANGGGMAIENALATASITNSTFSNNDAIGSGARGGGLLLYTNGTTPAITIQNSIFSLNNAYDGGGIYIYKLPVTITNSTIANNTTSNDGGGLYNYNGAITINSSTIKGNIANGGGNSEGGGIFNFGNTGTGSMTIVNSTLTGNSSTNGKGGAIFNHASGNTVNDIATINIVNSTIVGNNAKNNFGGGGIVASRAAGNEISSITLSNSIVYGNTLTTGTSGENCLIVNSVMIVTNNHNLFQTLANDCVPGVNDVTSNLAASAVVNALASNGGATQTMSLPIGSPAIDDGNDAICLAAPVSNSSQNGVTRPQGAHCDIGAYENQAIPPSGSTNIDITIAGTSQGTYPMVPETSQAVKYSLDGGPVVISSDNGVGIIASLNQWRRPYPTGGWTGVAQSMALPVSQISNSYVIPYYNGTDPTLYNAVLMANVDTVPRTITVTIGGATMGSYLLGPSDSRFEVYNVVGGPLVISSVSGSKIVASLYELKRAGASGEYNGQSEMMGLPSIQVSDKYLIPIYFGMWGGYLDASIAFANVDTISTTVDVKIGGVSRGTYLMQPSTSMVVKYLLDGGPVEISSNNGADIVASLNQWRRPSPTGGWTGVAQSMALPVGQISNSYVIPYYNGTDPSLYNAVLMANVDTVPRTITVTIGGATMGSYLLGPSDSRFEVYNVTGGPLVVSSDTGSKIVASLYELKRAGGAGEYNGQSEMMGLTTSLLSDKYLIPIYFGMWGGYLEASVYIGVP